MTSTKVCAVVVTFHPDSDVLENLSNVHQQVHSVVVVDNGSSLESITPIRTASSRIGFHLIENGENLGIATALNIGVRHAQNVGAEWVLLFDQDSMVTPGFTEAMLHGFATNRWGKQLAILVPRYVDKRLGSTIPGISVQGGGLEAAMTSGSLLPVSIFLEHGFFEDSLFIDAVDYEYSLRLRSRGLHIEECGEAILLHSPGAPRIHSFRGKYLFQTANYSPVRRYYQERNKIWVTRRYWTKFPFFCFKLFFFSVKDYFKILFAEDNKWEKLRACFLGVADGVRERMGRKDGL
jgi:rhamnosyltransferase